MSNKQAVHRLYDEHVNPGRLDDLSAFIAADYIGADGTRGPTAFASTIARLRIAFPDLHYTLEDVIAEGDKVAIRWTLRATHRGPFRDIPATGKRVVNGGFAIFRFADGKIIETTVDTDRLGFMIAIGRIPYDPVFGPPPRSE